PISGAEIVLLPDVSEGRSDPNGEFSFPLDEGKVYTLEARKPGYKPVTLRINTENVPDSRVIQALLEMEPDKNQMTLEGFTLDPNDRQLEGTQIFLINLDDQTEIEGVSGPDGSFSFPVEPGKNYQIVARKFGYRTGQAAFRTPESAPDGKVRQNVILSLPRVGQPVVLKNIYYDFDEWYIRQDAVRELQRLYKYLEDNPTLKVELSSHTDSRGSDTYNQRLSQQRADAAVRYLVYLGIDRRRLEPAGYGEMRHVNACSNGVECSEAQHQANRRTEFTILGFFKNGKDLDSEPVTDPYYYGAGKGERRPRPGAERKAVVRQKPNSNANGNGQNGRPNETVEKEEKANEMEKVEAKQPVRTNVGNGAVKFGHGASATANRGLPEPDPNVDICYLVQIGAFPNPNRGAEFKRKIGEYAQEIRTERIGNQYRYLVGRCGTVLHDVEELRGVARRAGFKGAFIVAWQNGHRVKLK
ncbi:MAG: carboxypeptidase regulatory-like domain-containing protein, partial [Bacteroidota bacterium]